MQSLAGHRPVPAAPRRERLREPRPGRRLDRLRAQRRLHRSRGDVRAAGGQRGARPLAVPSHRRALPGLSRCSRPRPPDSAPAGDGRRRALPNTRRCSVVRSAPFWVIAAAPEEVLAGLLVHRLRIENKSSWRHITPFGRPVVPPVYRKTVHRRRHHTTPRPFALSRGESRRRMRLPNRDTDPLPSSTHNQHRTERRTRRMPANGP